MPKYQKKQEKQYKNVLVISFLLLLQSKFITSLFYQFIFLLNRACEKCVSDKRRTINGNDLIYAMNQLGFERYSENLELYMDKY